MDVPSAEALGIWCWSGESLVPGWVVGFEGDLVGFSFGWASVFVGAAGLCGIMEDEVADPRRFGGDLGDYGYVEV